MRWSRPRLPFYALLCWCLALGSFALAQKPQLQGQWHCNAFTEHHALTVPSQPHHQFRIVQGQCSSTGGNKIAGETLKTDVVTGAAEVTATWMHAVAYDVITSNQGDHLYLHARESGRIVGGKPQTLHGHWRSVGGTGKLRNVHLSGTYTVTVNSDGTSDVKVQGGHAHRDQHGE